MELEFTGEVVEWRGPAPYHFVPLPPDEAEMVDEVKAEVAYWGVVPVSASVCLGGALGAVRRSRASAGPSGRG
jgi:hypothetical protein